MTQPHPAGHPTPRQLLKHMEVPTRRGVFILGCLERRVTLYSQQVRALNLAFSLSQEKRLAPGDKVLVIGGGAAGLTFAAGAAHLGAKVTLLESQSDVLSTFRGNHTRWLHPHIYEWPRPGSEQAHAELPLMDWSADTADKVARELLEQWSELKAALGIRVLSHAKRIKPVSSERDAHKFTWNAPGFGSDNFSLVIFAVGFGKEKQVLGVTTPSYWADNALHQPVPSSTHRVLVSGIGDGGVVDLLRLRLQDFRHETLVQELLAGSELERVKTALLDIEEDLYQRSLPPEELYQRYAALQVPDTLDQSLHERLRKDTRVVLNSPQPYPLSAESSILNRLLLSRLLVVDALEYRQGRIERVDRQKEEGPYKVRFETDEPDDFDRVIIRHGVRSALESDFPWLWKEVSGHLRSINTLDQSRYPIWDDQVFSRKRAPAPARSTKTRAPPPSRTAPPIGREEEVRQLVGALVGPRPDPMVVLGPPGIGKSTIASAAFEAPDIEKRYDKRRYFVCLDGVDTAEAIPARIAQAMEVRGVSDLWAQVLARLEEAPSLLILDNVDTPWQQDPTGTEELLEVLASNSELALLITVRGLHRPDFGKIPSIPVILRPLTYDDSLELFCSIATEVHPNHPELPALLREMEGVPLAVKLLAKQAEGVDLELTLKRWRTERTEMLRSVSDQNTSLAASIEFSLKDPRLPKEALDFLSVLALLPKGMAERHREDLFPECTGAVAFLQRAALVESEGHRWRLLVVIREHVRKNREPLVNLKRKTLDFYFSLAQRLGQQVGKANGHAAFKQLAKEIDNIEDLLLLALKEEEDTDATIDAALGVSDFVRFSGQGSAQPLLTAAAVAKRQGKRAKFAWCLVALSRLHLLRRPRYELARRLLQEALRLFQEMADPKGESECFRELGHTAANEFEQDGVKQQLEQADDYFKQALTLQTKFDDPIGEAYCIHGRARVALLQGRNEDARHLFRQTLHLFRRQKDELGQAYSLRHLGELEEDDRQLREACERFEEAGELRNLAHGLRSRSELARKRGEFDKAEHLDKQASKWSLKLQTLREAAASRINMEQAVEALLSRAASPGDPMPAPGNGAPTNRLPRRGHVFGREELEKRLVERLLAQEPLPTTVLGPPGVGKSTLTIAALHSQEVEKRYGPHRYFIRLDGVSTAARLNSEIAQELGLPAGQELPARMETLFGDKPALLVLDNAETPWEADRQATEELLSDIANIPGLALLLSVRGRVQPSLPRMGTPIEVPLLEPDAARDLFHDIAWNIERNDPLVEQLLAPQEGLALAVTLLARAAEGVSLEWTYERWQRMRSELLERPDYQDRSKNIAVSFELSLESRRMTATARRLLSVLSKLPVGVATEDLASLFPEDLDARTVLEKAGLVFLENNRLRMLAPLREYMQREHPPTPDDWLKATAHYTKLARKLGPQVGTANGAMALARLADEVPNLDVVLLDGLGSTAPQAAIDTVLKLNNFMRFSGYGTADTVTNARERARQLGDLNTEAQCLYTEGQLRLRRSEHERARELSQQALPLFEQLADPHGQARCLQTLGSIALDAQELENAQTRFEQAMPLRQRIGDQQGFGNCLHGLGKVALARKQLGEARGHFNEALRLFEQIDNDLGRAHCLRSLGELDGDVRQLEKAQGLFEKVGDLRGMGHCLRGRADSAFQKGHEQEADALYQQALRLLQQVGSVRGVANCLLGIGYLERKRGNEAAAQRAFEQALEKYQHVQDKAHEDECRRQLSGHPPPSARG